MALVNVATSTGTASGSTEAFGPDVLPGGTLATFAMQWSSRRAPRCASTITLTTAYWSGQRSDTNQCSSPHASETTWVNRVIHAASPPFQCQFVLTSAARSAGSGNRAVTSVASSAKPGVASVTTPAASIASAGVKLKPIRSVMSSRPSCGS